MHTTAIELQKAIDGYLPRLNVLSEEEASFKPSPVKWSKKELVGHLIDSAQNNIRRIIVSQYEENTTIIYKQDDWVRINNYQSTPLHELVQLWYLLNKQLSTVLLNTSAEKAGLICLTPNQHSLEWLAQDYVKHLKYHMHQVLNLEPVPYP